MIYHDKEVDWKTDLVYLLGTYFNIYFGSTLEKEEEEEEEEDPWDSLPVVESCSSDVSAIPDLMSVKLPTWLERTNCKPVTYIQDEDGESMPILEMHEFNKRCSLNDRDINDGDINDGDNKENIKNLSAGYTTAESGLPVSTDTTKPINSTPKARLRFVFSFCIA